jgi:hypothetical protein
MPCEPHIFSGINGLFEHNPLSSVAPLTTSKVKEEDFYAPFAVLFEQSVDELSEVNEIIELRVGRFPLPRGKKSASTDCSNTTPFADWLKNEVEDVTHAISLGGNKFKDKWGTPDVIGKRESMRSDIIKGPTEIVSAEIKTETCQLVTAFGQACAYKLFSHRVYLVVPRQAQKEEISRLDYLCQIFGIGLVTFDSEAPTSPDFRIHVRPARHEPDLFYTNKNMALIEKDLFS